MTGKYAKMTVFLLAALLSCVHVAVLGMVPGDGTRASANGNPPVKEDIFADETGIFWTPSQDIKLFEQMLETKNLDVVHDHSGGRYQDRPFFLSPLAIACSNPSNLPFVTRMLESGVSANGASGMAAFWVVITFMAKQCMAEQSPDPDPLRKTFKDLFLVLARCWRLSKHKPFEDNPFHILVTAVDPTAINPECIPTTLGMLLEFPELYKAINLRGLGWATPLHKALNYVAADQVDRSQLVTLLILSGPIAEIRDVLGETALDAYARICKDPNDPNDVKKNLVAAFELREKIFLSYIFASQLFPNDLVNLIFQDYLNVIKNQIVNGSYVAVKGPQ